MIRDRDRRVLAEIEQELRSTDPELCDRLSRLEDRPGAARSAVDRMVGNRAIVAWLVALGVAVLLGLSGIALLLATAVFTAVVVRLARTEIALPDSRRDPHPPPFGPPPGWLR